MQNHAKESLLNALQKWHGMYGVHNGDDSAT